MFAYSVMQELAFRKQVKSALIIFELAFTDIFKMLHKNMDVQIKTRIMVRLSKIGFNI